MTEIYKKIKGYENYEVSNFGNVKNEEGKILKPQQKLFNLRYNHIEKKDENIKTESCQCVSLWENGEKTYIPIKKLVYIYHHEHGKNYNNNTIVHKDKNHKNCNVNNLYALQKDIIVYQSLKNGNYNTYNPKTDKYEEMKRIPNIEYNCFEMFKGEINLKEFSINFKRWCSELKQKDKSNDYIQIYYDTYDNNHKAVERNLKRLTQNDVKNITFEKITFEEHNLFNKCYNAGLIKLNDKYLNKIVECIAVDFSGNYPEILASEKFHIPLTHYKATHIDKFDFENLKFGIYKCEIIDNNLKKSKSDLLFSYNTDNHYTHYDILFINELITKYNYDIEIKLIDTKINAYVYDSLISGDKIFGNFNNKMKLLKNKYKKNRLVKHLHTSIWGEICHPSIKNMTYEQIEEYGHEKINEKYEFGDLIIKNNGDEYYELYCKDNLYYFNYRIKPFLTAYARCQTAKLILNETNNKLKYCVRVQTDGVCFNGEKIKDIRLDKYNNLKDEDKYCGLLKWTHVNKCFYICDTCNKEIINKKCDCKDEYKHMSMEEMLDNGYL